jgi:hypothetical protein
VISLILFQLDASSAVVASETVLIQAGHEHRRWEGAVTLHPLATTLRFQVDPESTTEVANIDDAWLAEL